jgi:hypothetical protein
MWFVMSTPHAESTRRAHKAVTTIAIEDMANSLKGLLGPKLMAYTVDASERTCDRWIAGENPPNLDAERRLRCAYQIFELLKPVDSSAVIRAWFMGMNPQLDDLSPAEAIRGDQLRESILAARAFATGG